MAVRDQDIARLAWAQLDQDTRAEIIAAIHGHQDVVAPGVHARLVSTGLEPRGLGGPEAQSFLVPVALKNYLQQSGALD